MDTILSVGAVNRPVLIMGMLVNGARAFALLLLVGWRWMSRWRNEMKLVDNLDMKISAGLVWNNRRLEGLSITATLVQSVRVYQYGL